MRMVQEVKDSEIENFKLKKVLIIGITQDPSTRWYFEDELAKKLNASGVYAIRSIDFFEKSFTDAERSIKDLNQIEQQLLASNFNAVLFSKVIGKEQKTPIIRSYNELTNRFISFKEYYQYNQELFKLQYENPNYTVYHTETALFEVSAENSRKLMWKGVIDIVDPHKKNITVNRYTNQILRKFKKANIL